jgi:hypothetical protein
MTQQPLPGNDGSPLPLYRRFSPAWWWQRFGAGLAVGFVAWTIYAIAVAKPCEPPHTLFYLAFAWGVWPPLFWWIEFFFFFPKDYTKDKFEILKHGAQASLAIWAPIAVGLFAYASSDVFKMPPTPEKRAKLCSPP